MPTNKKDLTKLIGLLFLLIPAGLVFLAMKSPSPNAENAAPIFAPLHAQSPDSIIQYIDAGNALVLILPDSLAGQPVHDYTLPEPPALSWLVDQSFYWNTRRQDIGRYELNFKALQESTDIVSTYFVIVYIQ